MADLYYIDDDYYTPDGYFTYTADAVAAVVAAATVSCDAGKIVNAEIAQVTLFSTGVSAFVTTSASIDLTATTTLECGPEVFKGTNVTLSTIVSLSLQADKLKGTAAALNSSATVAADAVEYESYIATSPTPFYARKQALIVTTPTKFGSGALSIPDNTSSARTVSATTDWDFPTAGGSDPTAGALSRFGIAFWFYPTTAPGTNRTILSHSDGTDGWLVQINSSRQIRFFVSNNGGTVTKSNTTTGSLTLNQWNYVVISRVWENSTIRGRLHIAINGSEYVDDGTHDIFSGPVTSPLVIGDTATAAIGYLDGIEFVKANYIDWTVVPTSETVTATANHELILNFNGTWIDQSLGALETGSAALSSAFTVSAQPDQGSTKNADAALSSSAIVSASGGLLQEAVAALSSEFLVSAIGDDLDIATAALSATATMSVSADRFAGAQSAIATTATTSAEVVRIQGIIQNLAVTATVSASATELNLKDFFIQLAQGSSLLGESVCTDADDNVYALGWQTTSGELALIKYNSRGKLLWQKNLTIGVAADRVARNKIVYSNDYLYIGINYYTSGTWKGELYKITQAGTVVWNKLIANDPISDLVVTADTVYVCGGPRASAAYSIFAGAFAVSDGSKSWLKSYTFTSTIEHFEPNMAISGSTLAIIDYQQSNLDSRLTFINATDGTYGSQKVIDDVELFDIVASSDGYFYVLGEANNGSGVYAHTALMKFNSSGTIQWQKRINVGESPSTGPDKLTIDSSNNLYWSYQRSSSFDMTLAASIISFDSSGAHRWFREFDFGDGVDFRDINYNDGYLQLTGTYDPGVGTEMVTIQVPADASEPDFTLTRSGFTFVWSTLSAPTVYTSTVSVLDGQTITAVNDTATITSPSRTFDTSTYTIDPILVRFTGSSAVNAVFTTSVSAIRIFGPIFTNEGLTAAATTAVTAVKTARITKDLSASAAVTAAAIVVFVTPADLSVVATQTTNATKLTGIIKELSAAATVDAVVRKITDVTVSMTAFNTEVAVVVKTGQGLIACDSTATMAVTAKKITDVVSTMPVVVSQTAQAVKTTDVTTAITVTATQTTINGRLRDNDTASSAVTTVAAAGVRTRPAAAAISSQFTQVANATGLFVNTFLLNSSATIYANAVAGKLAIIYANSNFSTQLINDRIRSFACHMTAFNTQVTIGTKVTIDPYYQLIVPREISRKKIRQETAIIVVDSENRLNTVQPETNILTVPREISTWHIPYAPVVGSRRVK